MHKAKVISKFGVWAATIILLPPHILLNKDFDLGRFKENSFLFLYRIDSKSVL